MVLFLAPPPFRPARLPILLAEYPMIRRTLTTLVVALMIFAEPCLTTADTTPKKSQPKQAPQLPQASPTPTPSRQHLRQSYHPHQAKGSARQQPKRH
jgi:hypothetical protein